MRRIVIILLLLTLAACATQPAVVRPAPEAPDAVRTHPIFIANHGWHTGLIVPAAELNGRLPELPARFGDVPFYEIGWGDQGFYQAPEITTRLSLQAMFWSTGAILHVVGVPDSPTLYFVQSEVVRRCLTDGQMFALATFLVRSFAFGALGKIQPLTPGIYGDSQFYAAEGRYSLLNTCNTWTAKGLKSAGVDISPALTLTASGVMQAIRENKFACPPTLNLVP